MLLDIGTSFDLTFTAENANTLASFLVEYLEEGDRKEIDYDFNLSCGKMKNDQKVHANFSFKFDTKLGTIPRQIRDILSDETLDATEDRQKRTKWFFEEVGRDLTTIYLDQLRDRIRDVVFGKEIEKRLVPIENIVFIALDICDIPEKDDVLIVKRNIPKTMLLNQTGPDPVAHEIIKISDETGEDFQTIINRKKAEGDPNYMYITGFQSKKAFFECQLDLFVDFSFSKQ
jgi:hypothetical protein